MSMLTTKEKMIAVWKSKRRVISIAPAGKGIPYTAPSIGKNPIPLERLISR